MAKIGGQFNKKSGSEVPDFMGQRESVSGAFELESEPAPTVIRKPQNAPNATRKAPPRNATVRVRRRGISFVAFIPPLGLLSLFLSFYFSWMATVEVSAINQGLSRDVFNLLSAFLGAETLLHIRSLLAEPYSAGLTFFLDNALDEETARVCAWAITFIIVILTFVLAIILIFALIRWIVRLFGGVTDLFRGGADVASQRVTRFKNAINRRETERAKQDYNTDRMDSGLSAAARKQAMSRLDKLIRYPEPPGNSDEALRIYSYLRVQDLTKSGAAADRIERWNENGQITLDWESEERSYEILFRLHNGSAFLRYEDPDSGEEEKGEFFRNHPIVIFRSGRDSKSIPRYVITWFGGE